MSSRHIDPTVPFKGAFTHRFDDVGIYVYTRVFPLFKKYGVVGQLALAPEYLDTAGYITSAMAKEMAAAGWGIGFHGGHEHYAAQDSDYGWTLAHYPAGRDAAKTALEASLNLLRTKMGWAADYVPPVAMPPGHGLDMQLLPVLEELGFKYCSSPIRHSTSNLGGHGSFRTNAPDAATGWSMGDSYGLLQSDPFGKFKLVPSVDYYGTSFQNAQSTIFTMGCHCQLKHPAANQTGWTTEAEIVASLADLEATIRLLDAYNIPQVTLDEMCAFMMDPMNAELSNREVQLNTFGNIRDDLISGMSTAFPYQNYTTAHPSTDAGGPPSGNGWLEIAANQWCVPVMRKRLRGNRWVRIEGWIKNGTGTPRMLWKTLDPGSPPTTWLFTVPSSCPTWTFFRYYVWTGGLANKTLSIQVTSSGGTTNLADISAHETPITDPTYNWATDSVAPTVAIP